MLRPRLPNAVVQALEPGAARGIGEGSEVKVGTIQISVEAIMNVAVGQAAGNRFALGQSAAESRWSQTRREIRRAGAGVGDGERASGLEDGDAADSPVAEDRTFQAARRREERQLVAIAHRQAMSAVVVGKAA